MDLKEILARHEGKTLEFKRDLSSPGPIIKTIVAFANTAGGDLVIGVDDQTRDVVGVADPLGPFSAVHDPYLPCSGHGAGTWRASRMRR